MIIKVVTYMTNDNSISYFIICKVDTNTIRGIVSFSFLNVRFNEYGSSLISVVSKCH